MKDPRRAMLAKLHLAKKQLALTDDSYRDVLHRITGQDSAKTMRADQLDAALKEFGRLGWKPKAPVARAGAAQVRMIYAVWKDICALDSSVDKGGLRAFVKRQTRTEEHPDGIDSPEFLRGKMAERVLEGLKGWRARLKREEAA